MPHDAPAPEPSPLPEEFLPLALQLAAVVASLSQTYISDLPLFARVPRSDRAHLVLRGLLCASASLPVKLGLSVEEVATEVEGFARRLRSGEAEAKGAAVVAGLASAEVPALDPWEGEESADDEDSDDYEDDGDDDDDGQPSDLQEHADFAGDDDPRDYDGDLGGDW